MLNAFSIILLLVSMLIIILSSTQPSTGQIDTTPPTTPVKLAFIHHSTAVNWLAVVSTNELDGGMLA